MAPPKCAGSRQDSKLLRLFVNWLKSIFSSPRSPSSPQPSSRRRPAPRIPADARPYDYVDAGIEAWDAKESVAAERLLRQGVDAYRTQEPSGTDFALGRLAAFLLEQERVDEAAALLEEAIETGTNIPALWFDYLEIMAIRKDIDGLFKAANRSTQSTTGSGAPWNMLLSYARSADRAGDSAFAEAIAQRVVVDATAALDQGGRWAAIGDLGHILERADQLDRAMDHWKSAFAEGSNDPTTANRLSMHLERARDYSSAIAIIEEAFDRALPANVEEQLRKRLERCRSRMEGRRRSDVSAFSVREGEGALELVFQTRVSPPLRTLSVLGSVARGFGVSKGVGTLVDFSLADGAEVERTTELPSFSTLQFAPSGWGIGTERTGRIGEGVTRLFFITPSGSVERRSEVPDATSEIALGPNIWYVGCRDGRLYAFDFEGKSLWKWETPGARDQTEDAYFQLCPYYVSSDGERATVSSMGDLYCINPKGKTVWHYKIPAGAPTMDPISIPLGDGIAADQAYGELGVAPGTPTAEVQRAYRKRAMETHPDRNPGKPDSGKEFQRVHAAYEAIMAGNVLTGDGPTITISISIQGMDPTVTHLIAARGSAYVGSSDGKLYVLNTTGAVTEMHALGEYLARPFVNAAGILIAAWCDGTVFYFEDGKLRNLVETEDLPQGIGAFGDGLYLWHRRHLEVVDRTGHTIWSAEFSKNINEVAAYGDYLLCAAGVLAAFRKAAL